MLSSCARVYTAEQVESAADRYAARATVAWQRTCVFLLTGRARLEGGNLLAEGRFAIWGDPLNSLLRCDFCGPDGRPVLSAAGDSSGVTLYYPRDEAALYVPGGLPVAGAVIPVRSVLFLLRTGMPVEMEHWVISTGVDLSGDGAEWLFAGIDDSVTVELSPGDIFPSSLSWNGGLLEPGGATPGDEYDAWPSTWIFRGDSLAVRAEISSVRNPAESWPGVWDLQVPVEVDTLRRCPPLAPAWTVDIE